jgi:protein-tyrosine-phosphatase
MAEVLARGMAEKLGLRGVEVRSAGTHARAGMPASEGALRAARRHGYSLEDHEATELSPDLVAWAHHILVMGPGHLHRVQLLGGDGKVFLLGSAAREGGGGEGISTDLDLAIPDPFGGDDALYEETFRTLNRYLELFIKRLVAESGE